ncbi:MAG: hypothetical protein HOQ28_01490 [Thermoleophilia bacterium]|nr:hypothetical protein [Thermoleophilia bacterium]
MKLVFALVAVLAAAVAVAAPSSHARGNTTSPGFNFRIDVVITDHGVTLSRTVAKRGWLAHFVIVNKGKQAHVFDVGGLKTKRIAPGNKAKLGSYLDVRGQFAYKVDNKTRGYFTVT